MVRGLAGGSVIFGRGRGLPMLLSSGTLDQTISATTVNGLLVMYGAVHRKLFNVFTA
jgi:hypothetical protein